jgi:hypothetical protein
LKAYITSLDFSYNDVVSLPLTSSMSLELKILASFGTSFSYISLKTPLLSRELISLRLDSWKDSPGAVITPCLRSSIARCRSRFSFSVRNVMFAMNASKKIAYSSRLIRRTSISTTGALGITGALRVVSTTGYSGRTVELSSSNFSLSSRLYGRIDVIRKSITLLLT